MLRALIETPGLTFHQMADQGFLDRKNRGRTAVHRRAMEQGLVGRSRDQEGLWRYYPTIKGIHLVAASARAQAASSSEATT